MEIILKYFPELNEIQRNRFAQLQDLYLYWNARINVISRQDIGNLYANHVLHSLAIAKVITFKPGTKYYSPMFSFIWLIQLVKK